MKTKTKTWPITVHFFNYANGSASFSVGVDYAALDVIAKHAKTRLGSRFVWAAYDENADQKPAITGTIFAGMRAVARFRVIDAQQPSQDS